jgi:hypothetical protein
MVVPLIYPLFRIGEGENNIREFSESGACRRQDRLGPGVDVVHQQPKSEANDEGGGNLH